MIEIFISEKLFKDLLKEANKGDTFDDVIYRIMNQREQYKKIIATAEGLK